MGTLVVGVDGSPGALAAARLALEEARLRGARLELIAAWHVPPSAFGGFAPAVPELPDDLEEEARKILAETVAALGPDPGVDVSSSAREGNAAQILIDASSGADLLVVGSRGLGGFRELLLGSVSHQCAQHAHCPVVIVRAGTSADRPA